MHLPSRDGYVVAIFGDAGSGKTTFAARCLRELPPDRGALVYDHTGDLARYLGERGQRARTWEEGLKIARGGWFAKPGIALFDSRHRSHFTYAAAPERAKGLTIYIDEAEELLNESAYKTNEDTRNTIERARNFGLEVIVSGKRPQNLALRSRSCMLWVFAMRLSLESSITRGLAECANPALWGPVESLPKHRALMLWPWRENARQPLIEYDTRTDPLPFRMRAADFDAWLAPRLKSA